MYDDVGKDHIWKIRWDAIGYCKLEWHAVDKCVCYFLYCFVWLHMEWDCVLFLPLTRHDERLKLLI